MRKAAKRSARLRPVGHPEVVILSEKNAQLYEPSGREVCISITGPKKQFPSLSDRFAAVLRLAFSDITEPMDHPDSVLFNDGHAKEIVTFIGDWRDVNRIVIHCQAGLSRSPGVAMGLCELFSWGAVPEENYPLCNQWVRRELVRVGRLLAEPPDR